MTCFRNGWLVVAANQLLFRLGQHLLGLSRWLASVSHSIITNKSKSYTADSLMADFCESRAIMMAALSLPTPPSETGFHLILCTCIAIRWWRWFRRWGTCHLSTEDPSSDLEQPHTRPCTQGLIPAQRQREGSPGSAAQLAKLNWQQVLGPHKRSWLQNLR